MLFCLAIIAVMLLVMGIRKGNRHYIIISAIFATIATNPVTPISSYEITLVGLLVIVVDIYILAK